MLYGPKAAGKSQVAAILRRHHRLTHIDPHVLVLDLVARGDRPHRRLGWLPQVEDAIEHALKTCAAVSVEATGAWESEWQLTNDLKARGHQVLTVWVLVPLELIVPSPLSPPDCRRPDQHNSSRQKASTATVLHDKVG